MFLTLQSENQKKKRTHSSLTIFYRSIEKKERAFLAMA